MEPSTPRQALKNARRKFNELRTSIDRFHRARSQSDAAALGVVENRYGVSAAQLSHEINGRRDIPMMREAIQRTNDLLSVIHGRSPSEAELVAGPPSGEALGNFVDLSSVSSVHVLVGLAAGAWALTSIFNYLREREERIQAELGIPRASEGNSVALPIALTLIPIAAVGVGYYWWKTRKGGEVEAEVRELPQSRRTTIEIDRGGEVHIMPATEQET